MFDGVWLALGLGLTRGFRPPSREPSEGGGCFGRRGDRVGVPFSGSRFPEKEAFSSRLREGGTGMETPAMDLRE